MNKKTILIFAFTMLISRIYGQVKVTYAEEYRVTKEMEAQMTNSVVADIVKQQLDQLGKNTTLYVVNGKSIYEAEKKKSSQADNVTVYSMGSGGKVYKNEKDKEIISEESILDRSFLVVENMPLHHWIHTGESKQINGYTCQKASTDTGVIAWYCPDIKINDGPSVYCGLPGLILEVEMSGRKITMEDIDMDYQGEQILRPSKGKTISREEFDSLKQKKLKEMNVTPGGGVKVFKLSN